MYRGFLAAVIASVACVCFFIGSAGAQTGRAESVARQWALATAKIDQAAAAKDIAAHDRALDQAIALLEKIVAATRPDKDKSPAHYRYAVKLAEVTIMRIEPSALKLICLQGGQRERQAVRRSAAKAARMVDRLAAEMHLTLRDWRTEPAMLVTVVPPLEELSRELRYRSGWVHFYHAVSLPGSEARKVSLRLSVEAAGEFAGDAESPVRYLSLLLMGMARCELGEFDAAAANLLAAAVPQAGSYVRLQAWFSLARNAIEQARSLVAAGKSTAADEMFRQALRAIGEFRRNGAAAAGTAGLVEVDAKGALLENYLYETRAAGEIDADKVRRYAQKSQESLLAFLRKYPDPGVQEAFHEIIAGKFADRSDEDRLPSIVLVAMASVELAGDAGLQSPSKEVANKAERMLRKVLDRTDPASIGIRPRALWQLAILRSRQNRPHDAGMVFLELSKEFPADPLAFPAARNAVISFAAIIADRIETRQPVATATRVSLVDSLKWLLRHWGRREGIAKYYFDLGWQLEKLAEVNEGGRKASLISEAIDAYEKVPAGLAESMPARRNGLGLRVDRLLGQTPRDPAVAVEARSLIVELEAFAAAAEAGPAQTAWALTAEFDAARLRYEVMGRTTRAMEAIAALVRKSAGLDVQSVFGRYEITRLIEAGKTGDAIAKVSRFRKNFPAESHDLVAAVVFQIRSSIEDMQDRPDQMSKLARYRSAYVQFARDIYAEAAAQTQDPDELYSLRQMYADSLLVKGSADEAIALFAECERHDIARCSRRKEEIDKAFSVKVQAVRAASQNANHLEALAAGYLKELTDEYAVRKEDFQPATKVQRMYDFLRRAQSAAETTDRMPALTEALVAGYEALGGMVKRGVPADPENILGLARAHAWKKQYSAALRYYDRLIAGTDPRDVKFYWRAQFERCRCILQSNRGDREALKTFLVLLKQLRAADSRQGGLRAGFDRLEVQARRLLAR